MYEQLQFVLSQLHSAWRFRWWAIAVAWLVCVAGWAWVALQPDIYEARTRVYIDTTSSLQRVLNDQIIPVDVDAQLRFVEQSLLGSVQLERVARQNDLHLEADSPADMQRVILGLRKSIAIQSSSTGGRGARNPDDLYTISYRDSDPARALSIVSTLLNTFVEDTRSAETSAADVNQGFLRRQIADYETRLRDAEDRLAEFKKDNKGKLPGAEGGYYTRLQAETDALEQSRKELALAQSRRSRIIEQLSGQSRTVSPALSLQDLPENSLEARIAESESELESLLLRFTDKHPDVIAMQEQLDALRERLESERSELASAGGASAILQNNPVYQALQISLNEVEVEIANLTADVNSRSRKVNELNALINEVPEVEAELARLNRDYEIVYGQYQLLVQSLEKENLSTAAQQSDQVEFRVIDPPVTDADPVAPNRAQLLALVLVVAFGAGAGLAVLLAQLKPVFINRRTLSNVTGLPVLGAVSMSVSPAERKRRLVQASGFGVAVAGLIAAFAVVFLVEVLGPGLVTFARMV